MYVRIFYDFTTHIENKNKTKCNYSNYNIMIRLEKKTSNVVIN